MFQANSSFDQNHCLRDYNQFSVYYNLQLRAAIVKLQLENPSVTVVYVNLYLAFERFFSRARYSGLLRIINIFVSVLSLIFICVVLLPCIHLCVIGFDPNSLLKACCGSGGNYNFGFATFCGIPEVPVCSNPNQYICWDGFHLTQQAAMYMADYLISNLPPVLHCR